MRKNKWPSAICSWVQHSEQLKEAFNANVLVLKEDAEADAEDMLDDDDEIALEDADGSVSVGVAKHRFDSLAKRLRRVVRKVQALIATPDWMIRFRAGKPEADYAKRTVQMKLDDECFKTWAFMAEAAEELRDPTPLPSHYRVR